MFEEISNSLKARLYDFTVSPLLVTFVASWLIWNYRFWLLLTSPLSYQEKILIVKGDLFPCWYDRLLGGFVYPFGSAILFLLLYPLIANPVYKFWRQQHNKLRQIKKELDDQTPLTREDEVRIREEIRDVANKYLNPNQRLLLDYVPAQN